MEIYKSAESRLCKGLIQSSGIKPPAWGLNWNFSCADPTGTRRRAGSGAARAVGSKRVLNPVVSITLKKKHEGVCLSAFSLDFLIFLLNLR